MIQLKDWWERDATWPAWDLTPTTNGRHVINVVGFVIIAVLGIAVGLAAVHFN